jgi:hypothetical protein
MVSPPFHLLFNFEKKEDHETGPIDSRKRERETMQRRVNDPLSCVNLLNGHSGAILAVIDSHNHKALIVIAERSTIPACVYFVTSSGVAPTCIGVTSRRTIPKLTLTR